LVICLVIACYINDLDRGQTGHLVHVYLTGLVFFFIVTIVEDVFIVRISMRGTIVDDAPRRNITLFLYGRLAILAAEFMWTMYGEVFVILYVFKTLSNHTFLFGTVKSETYWDHEILFLITGVPYFIVN